MIDVAAPLTEEEKQYLQDTTSRGPAPLSEEELAYAEDREPVVAEKTPPSVGSGLLHVAKGPGNAAFMMADMPSTLSNLARSGVEGAFGLFGKEAPDLTAATEPYIGQASKLFGLSPLLAPPITPKVSELPYGEDVYEAIASPEPGMEGTPYDMARTGAEWSAMAPFNAARGARYGADLIMGGGAMAGKAYDEYLGEKSAYGEPVAAIGALLANLLRGKVPHDVKSSLEYIRNKVDDAATLALAASISGPDCAEPKGSRILSDS